MGAVHRPETRSKDLSALALGLALLLLASPLRLLWARDDSPWLLPFGLWAAVIFLGGLASRRRPDA